MFINKSTGTLILLYGAIFFHVIAYAAQDECKTSPIQFSGAIESEIGIATIPGDEHTSESDCTLATVELGIDVHLSDNVMSHLLL